MMHGICFNAPHCPIEMLLSGIVYPLCKTCDACFMVPHPFSNKMFPRGAMAVGCDSIGRSTLRRGTRVRLNYMRPHYSMFHQA
jgi:hypothetical protein